MNLFRLIMILLKPLICANCSCTAELTHSSLPRLWWYPPLVNIVSCGFRLYWPCSWSSCLAHNLLTYCVHHKCWINQPGFVKKKNKEKKTCLWLLKNIKPIIWASPHVPLCPSLVHRQTQVHRHRYTLSWASEKHSRSFQVQDSKSGFGRNME